MIGDLLRIANAFGDRKIAALMMEALRTRVPHGGGGEASLRYFGDELTTVLKRIAPTIISIDEMAPGFRDWLETTGYGDDMFMLAALLAITDRLDAMPAPLHLQRNRPGLIKAGA